MSKNKRKMKYFQGMEHLRRFSSTDQGQTGSNIQNEQIDNSSALAAKSTIRRELLTVAILMGVLFIILISMMLLDKKTEIIDNIAARITEFAIH